jgi:protein arginine kinase
MNIDDLADKVGEWLRGVGPLADIVISSRIRLARNLADFPFLSRASDDQRREILRTLGESISSAGLDKNALFLDIDELDEIDRQVLVERHLISQQHAEGQGCRGVAISTSETRALMINEEDHLRMQVLRSGLQLEPLWEEICELDHLIEAQTRFRVRRPAGLSHRLSDQRGHRAARFGHAALAGIENDRRD